MIFGMISYAQKNYTSLEHMVVTPSYEQESHIEDCYFTVKDSLVVQTNKTRDSIILYRMIPPFPSDNIERFFIVIDGHSISSTSELLALKHHRILVI